MTSNNNDQNIDIYETKQQLYYIRLLFFDVELTTAKLSKFSIFRWNKGFEQNK